MKIIRERVATRGAALDDFPGLGLKAYLIRERGVDGSPVNQYAPFYLWQSPAGMNRFLWGGEGFHGIVRDFGRPAVRHWTGVALEHGPSRTDLPRYATRRNGALPGRGGSGGDRRRAVHGARSTLHRARGRPVLL
jgi:hypothetical protein